ncbi:AarF/ABC1/UbiB kinase family protein [bacterium]|nr:AarF/ABC1/UbiB kinase family protein [bacterium]
MKLIPKHINFQRYRDIIRLFIKYGLSDLVIQSGLPTGKEDEDVKNEAQQTKAEELPKDLEQMGCTFIKFGQFLSAFSDVLPTHYVEELSRLQDKVEPFSYEEAEEIIESELGVKISKAFSSFDQTPISAASLSQVHKAIMRDGRQVAVKVQRPHIRKYLFTDLEVLEYIADILEERTHIGKINRFRQLILDFRRSLLRELDFQIEAENLAILNQNLEEFHHITLPKPVEDYTANRVLTMDFIDGVKVHELSSLPSTRGNRNRLADELLSAYLKQILVDGFFHADPHPGNIILTNDHKVALLDLGMVGNLSDNLQESLLKIFLGISEGDGQSVANETMKIAEREPSFNEQQFTQDICTLVNPQQYRDAGNIKMGRLVLDLSRMAKNNGIYIPPIISVLGKTLLNLDQVGRELAPNFDPNDCIRREAGTLIHQRILKTFAPSNIMNSMLEMKDLLSNLPMRMNQIIDSLANNKLSIHVDAIDEKKLINGFQKIANRITIGLIMAALIIGAALMMNIDSTFTLFGYPVLAIFFFLLAAAGGVVLILKILFSDEGTRF